MFSSKAPPIGGDLRFILEAVERMQLAAHGPFTAACEAWLERRLGAPRVLLTSSGTAALEMAMLLAGIGWGDEVIMPSFTSVSTANAVVLRGARPVFVDIRADTHNLDERLVEAAVTRHTRAIVPVHYAGVAAEMDALLAIARKHDLALIEDAAHGMFATSRKRPLGTMGDLGALSFHAANSVTAGEGGALVINKPALVEQAERIWEKGTDRAQQRRGEIGRTTWHTVGSSFAPSEITAAFLWAQLQGGEAATRRRRRQWRRYHQAFAPLQAAGLVRRPAIPDGCAHNGHLYRLLLSDAAQREAVLACLARQGVDAAIPDVPLHATPAGGRYGRVAGDLRITEDAASRSVRLPLHERLSETGQAAVIDAIRQVCCERAVAA